MELGMLKVGWSTEDIKSNKKGLGKLEVRMGLKESLAKT